MSPHPGEHHLVVVVHMLLCTVTEVLKEGLVVTLEVSFLNEYPSEIMR